MFIQAGKKNLFALALIISIAAVACKHDPIIPPSAADEVSFQNDISPILVANCTMSGCHPNMGQYNQVIHDVKPGNPNDSELYEVITRSDNERMPLPPNPRLTDDQIRLIYLWIAQGAQNN